MRPAEDPLVDHLQGTRHGNGARGSEYKGGHDGGCGMGRGGPEELAHDQRALAVKADMSAQIGVDPVIGERTQQDHERQHGDQQRGPEQDDRVGEVQGAEPLQEGLRR